MRTEKNSESEAISFALAGGLFSGTTSSLACDYLLLGLALVAQGLTMSRGQILYFPSKTKRIKKKDCFAETALIMTETVQNIRYNYRHCVSG